MADKDQADLLSESEGPISTFQSLFAEGDGLWKQGDFQKAVEAFSKALIMKPGDKTCLIARSKCYLLLGNPNSALLDAEEALKEDRSSYKAMFAKAEALYSKGDFEMALLHYHRGYQAKPDVDDFRLGIQKAKEAINNAIGDPKDHKIKVPKNGLGVDKRKSPRYMAAFFSSESAKKEQEIKDRHEKQLLGELHEDKKYLKHFLDDEGSVNHSNERLKTLVSATLNYLDSRIEFWRQQKPIYARKKKGFKAKNSLSDAVGRHALELKQIKACFRNIERCYATKDMDTAISFAQSLLRKLTGNGEKLSDPSTLPVPEKDYKSCLSQCYQWFGKIYMSIGNKTTAVTYFKRDVVHCKKAQIPAVSSLKQLSNIYLSFKKYNDAIIYLTHLLKQSTEPEDLLQAIIDLSSAYLFSGDAINAKRIFDKHYAFLDQVALEEKGEWQINLDKLSRKLDGVEEEPFVDPEQKPQSAKKTSSARSTSGYGSKQLTHQNTNTASNKDKKTSSSSRLRSANKETTPQNSASRSNNQSSSNRHTTSSKAQPSATKPKSSGSQKKEEDDAHNTKPSTPESAARGVKSPTSGKAVVIVDVVATSKVSKVEYEEETLQEPEQQNAHFELEQKHEVVKEEQKDAHFEIEQHYEEVHETEQIVSVANFSSNHKLEEEEQDISQPHEQPETYSRVHYSQEEEPVHTSRPEVNQFSESFVQEQQAPEVENYQTQDESAQMQEQKGYDYHDEHFEEEPSETIPTTTTQVDQFENEEEHITTLEQDQMHEEHEQQQEQQHEEEVRSNTQADETERETRFEKTSIQDLPKLPSQQQIDDLEHQPGLVPEDL